MKRTHRVVAGGAAVFTGLAMAVATGLPASAIVAGAGYTTAVDDAHCLHGTVVNCNAYADKADVYGSGGPTAGGIKTAGSYVFYVLEPGAQNTFLSGTGLLSTDSDAERTVTIGLDGSGNPIIVSYDGTTHTTATNTADKFIVGLAPFDDSSNPGGVYIFAICSAGATSTSQCKFDAFKVASGGGTVTDFGVIAGEKYYDANANGQLDPGEIGIANWPINYSDGVSGTLFTDSNGEFSDSFVADTYTFAESLANSPWMQTGNTVDQTSSTGGASATLNGNKTYSVTTVDGSLVTGLNFGNLCIGGGGGLTLGFWSNRNGQALFTSGDLAALVALNLRNASGSNFDPGNYAAFKSWLLNATATNMAYMLSAQLSAMKLNVAHNFVNGSSLIYAPGTLSANSNGFATVNDVMAEANTSLGTNGLTVASGPVRTYQEALKTALDKANNNLNFVQPGPSSCPSPVFPS